MKFKLSKIVGLMLMVITFASCEKVEDQAIANVSSASAGTLATSVTAVTLTKASKDIEAVKFTFGKTNYGFQAAVKYTLQMDVKGNNFAKPKEISVDASNLVKSLTGLELNDVALALGLKPDLVSVIQIRSKSEIGPSVSPIYSAPIELSVKPFALVAFVYVPGDYQGWNPSIADSLMSVLGDGKYEGIINFASKANSLEFKITPKKEWNVAYGDDGSGKVSSSAGNNLKASALYPHRISLNLNENTVAMEKFSYGVIGDATPGGWDNDTNMNYDNGKREWSVTLNLIANKELKFRLNDDWGTNYGDNGADGTLDKDGANIKITSSGSYKIVISFVTNAITITKL
jgi:hypothetical protein